MRRVVQSLFAIALAFAGVSTLASSVARAEDKPSTIRMAYPGVGVGNRPFVGGNTIAIAHLRGMFEEEFKKDGITVNWTFTRGAGPAVNELYANGLVDFSLLGDLPSIIGHAGGLKTKVLAATSIRQLTYVVVPTDSRIQTVKDLKGKRVAIFKGTNIQLAAAKILESFGLSEKDLKVVNMDTNSQRAALLTGDIDAAFGDFSYLPLRDQQVARVIYRTAEEPKQLRHCSFIGAESFIQKYPELTTRVVKTLVRSAKWASDQEKTPNNVFQLWSKSGTPYSNFKEDVLGRSLTALSSPLIDPFFVGEYTKNISEAKRFGLIRETFSLEKWIDKRFLDAALKELGLENFWQPVPAASSVKLASAAP